MVITDVGGDSVRHEDRGLKSFYGERPGLMPPNESHVKMERGSGTEAGDVIGLGYPPNRRYGTSREPTKLARSSNSPNRGILPWQVSQETRVVIHLAL